MSRINIILLDVVCTILYQDKDMPFELVKLEADKAILCPGLENLVFRPPPHSIRLVMPGDWRAYKPVYKILICRDVTFLRSVQNTPKYLCIIKAESSQFTDFE